MIKRIIFDVDNTLLDTDSDCINAYKKFLSMKNYNINEKDIYDAFDKYEINGGNYDKDDLSSFFRDELGVNFSRIDLDELLNIYGEFSSLINPHTKDILEYLGGKYEVVCLSNWFNDNQLKRLEKSGIDECFSFIYGFNEGFKPNEDVFIKACGKEKMDECLMIGDSIKNDMETPSKLGMNVLLFNRKDIISTYKSIKSLDELKEML